MIKKEKKKKRKSGNICIVDVINMKKHEPATRKASELALKRHQNKYCIFERVT